MTQFTTVKTKKELAIMLQVSPSTLRRWLNQKYYSNLKFLGYTKNQRILTPGQLNYLNSILDI